VPGLDGVTGEGEVSGGASAGDDDGAWGVCALPGDAAALPGDAAAELDDDVGGTVGTAGAVEAADVELAAPPPETPAPTGVGAATLSAAPQSSQYSAPAGFSC
jgi:hypothetical protein